MTRFALIDESRSREVEATIDGDRVGLATEVVQDALGWNVEERGLCQDTRCVPIKDRERLLGKDGSVDLRELAETLDRPLVIDLEEGIAALGRAAGERAEQLASLEAPDFELPDLQGQQHSLSEHRGKKVLLVTWASW